MNNPTIFYEKLGGSSWNLVFFWLVLQIHLLKYLTALICSITLKYLVEGNGQEYSLCHHRDCHRYVWQTLPADWVGFFWGERKKKKKTSTLKNWASKIRALNRIPRQIRALLPSSGYLLARKRATPQFSGEQLPRTGQEPKPFCLYIFGIKFCDKI